MTPDPAAIAGLSVGEASATSVIVVAGAAQFAMVDLLRRLPRRLGLAYVLATDRDHRSARWRGYRGSRCAAIAGVVAVAALRAAGL